MKRYTVVFRNRPDYRVVLLSLPETIYDNNEERSVNHGDVVSRAVAKLYGKKCCWSPSDLWWGIYVGCVSMRLPQLFGGYKRMPVTDTMSIDIFDGWC